MIVFLTSWEVDGRIRVREESMFADRERNNTKTSENTERTGPREKVVMDHGGRGCSDRPNERPVV